MKDKKSMKKTTCFSEHQKYALPCKKCECRYWHAMKEYHNCTIIAAASGPKTLQEIGNVFNITRMRICQIEKSVLKKLNKKYHRIMKGY